MKTILNNCLRSSRLILALLFFCSPAAFADEASVAVASNFLNPLKQLATLFSQATGHHLNISSGSTGKLYAQIINGAPFDIFLAADEDEPLLLERQGNGVPESRFTYALGKLVLWSADPERIKGNCVDILKNGKYEKLAIANPRTAPYGKQALFVLYNLKIYKQVRDKLVKGASITQAFQFVYSRNAELGIVSLSQVKDPNKAVGGSYCLIPPSLYSPLIQQAVLLQRAEHNNAAKEFLAYLQTPEAKAVIADYGYDLP